MNLVAPGDKVIVCRNGVFGGRMIENVERCGGIAVVVDDEWGKPVDPQKVEDAFKQASRREGARLRARRDLHRRAVRRQGARADRAQARRAW